MKDRSDKESSLQELLVQIGQLLECDGITQVQHHSGAIHALVEGISPVLINYVPNYQTKEDESVLQIYFSLSQLHTDNIPLLLERLDELNRHTTLGSLCLLPHREIGYKHRLPINLSAQSQAATNFKLSMQLMLLFLFEFLPYVQILSTDPESVTLAQYLAEEG